MTIGAYILLLIVVTAVAAGVRNFVLPLYHELVWRRQWIIVCNTPGCTHVASHRLSQQSALPCDGAMLRWRDVCSCHLEWGKRNLELTEKEDVARLTHAPG